MKKSLLTLGVACMALSSFASTRVLYTQNFEKAADPAAAGWADYRGLMTIASDEYGKFLEINQNGQNGGSTFVKWGQDIFMSADGQPIVESTYNVHFEFQIANSTCNQFNSEITIFTNHDPITNQGYRAPWSPAGYWQNYLFDVSQVDDGTKEPLLYVINGGTNVTENTAEDGTVTTSYSIDFADPTTFATNTWYLVDLTVNVNTREVEYMVETITGETVKGGTITVPETNIADGSEISMYAEGLNVMLARTNTTYDIDNIKVSVDIDGDWANDPAVALTRIGRTADDELNLNLRAYTIQFAEGETLHLIGTEGGDEEKIEYDECEGEYVYETTTSGTLKAWTTSGEATSEVIETEVECAPVVLPEALATISSVGEGYGKTYTLTVSNANVPLQPTIFIDYEFVGESGNKIAAEGEASGVKLAVTEKGTLKITTAAFGYESTTTTVTNDVQFETKKAWDFARLSKEEIVAAGFPAEFNVLNSDATSGFNNWTARKRLYYTSSTETEEVVDEEGNVSVVAKTVYPFGFVDAESTTNVIDYTVIDRAAIAETSKGEYFDGLTIFPERGKVAEGGLPNVGMLYRIGLYNDQTSNNNNNVYIHDLDENDFVVVNYINNYGGNSNHPSCATDDEYYAVLAGEDAVYSVAQSGVLNEETNTYDIIHALYRIDTAITKITVYKQAEGAVEAINATVAGDNNWYSIDGVRVAEPTRPGLYIHNGKKIIVK